jgi:hypothetical protein
LFALVAEARLILPIQRMANPKPDNDEPTEKPINLRLDAKHRSALESIAEFENLKLQDTIRRLIRVAHRRIHGTNSPFAEDLGSIFSRKVG